MSEACGTGTSAVRIRAVEPPDAAALAALEHRLDRERQFVLLERLLVDGVLVHEISMAKLLIKGAVT